jgi:hypothetical protein
MDEFKTSKVCPKCHEAEDRNSEVVGGLRRRPSPRPWRRGIMENVHGLLGCTNLNCFQQLDVDAPILLQQARVYFNRDALATSNMWHILNSMLAGNGRPPEFCRPTTAIPNPHQHQRLE